MQALTTLIPGSGARNLWRRALLVILVSLLTACATTRSDVHGRRIEVEHPLSVAGFTRESIYQAEDPQEGTRLRYLSDDFDGLRVDLFAYLVGTSDDHEEALDVLRDGFVESMAQARDNGTYSSYEWLDRKSLVVMVNGRKRPARFLRHVQVSPVHGELLSHTYLLFRPPFALKVRASFPSKGNTSFDEAISAFVHAVIPEIKVTFPANCKGLKTTIYVDPDGAACELPLRLVEAFQKTAEFGCEDYESAEEMNALLPKLVAECEAESGAEPNAKPGK